MEGFLGEQDQEQHFWDKCGKGKKVSDIKYEMLSNLNNIFFSDSTQMNTIFMI